MKKLVLFFAVVLAVSFSSCGNKKTAAPAEEAPAVEQAAPAEAAPAATDSAATAAAPAAGAETAAPAAK